MIAETLAESAGVLTELEEEIIPETEYGLGARIASLNNELDMLNRELARTRKTNATLCREVSTLKFQLEAFRGSL